MCPSLSISLYKGTLPPVLALKVGNGCKSWGAQAFDMDVIPRDIELCQSILPGGLSTHALKGIYRTTDHNPVFTRQSPRSQTISVWLRQSIRINHSILLWLYCPELVGWIKDNSCVPTCPLQTTEPQGTVKVLSCYKSSVEVQSPSSGGTRKTWI